ncbi:MAG: cytochrome C oxidase subunit IV family protein [Actinomycetia bacterium]|nr:cytochrome C oxidase subunit IV family protein [Actinomycetes bacterium]
MSEHAEHAEHAEAHDHPTNSYFIWTALVLALFTALETSTYWIDFGSFATPLLLILMTIKFFVILLVFMHLKYDSKLFGAMFYIGLGLALGVYTAALCTFQFFVK